MTMKDNKSDRSNLAIIGASGTGKTTLAVGLYATSTESFTVSPVGDETRKYLEIRKTSIEEGFWPAATNESENFDLRLRLHASGNQTDIVFREYMGERMERDPNYIREVIGTPKSAMILFNPGMPGLSKPETRNRMLGNLKVIAQHLKDNGCIAVAFVVTASDRLTSDLAAFREDFEVYASEVTNHLTNLGLEWKRFEVTVSGQLDDQNKPKLARGENNTTHEPFLWLLKRIRNSKRCKYLLTVVAVVAPFLGVSGAVFGGLVVHSHHVLTRAERAVANTTNTLNMAYAAHDEAKVRTASKFFETNSFDKIRAILPSDRMRKAKLVNRANEERDLWRVRLLSMEFASNRNKIATKPLDVQTNWFEDFNKRLSASLPDFRDAVIERDTLTNEWGKSRSEMERVCQTAHFRDEVDQERKNLASAKPDTLSAPLQKSKELIADAVTYALVTNRAVLCTNLGLMTARTNAIVRFVDSKMGKPEDANPPNDASTLRQQISKELKKTLTSEEFNRLADIISERHSVARTAWEKHKFPLQARAQIDELKAVSDAPADALRNSRVFLEGLDGRFPSIPEKERSDAKKSIEAERGAAIDRYLNAKTTWKLEDDEPPDDTAMLQGQVRVELKSALTEVELENLLGELKNRRDVARKDWEKYNFPLRLTEREAALKGTVVANLNVPLRESLDFLRNMDELFPSIPDDRRSAAKASIKTERDAALGRYLDAKTMWNPEDEEPPNDTSMLQQQASADLIFVLTDDEFNSLSEKLAERQVAARKAWDAYHFPRRVTELETALKGAGSDPRRSLTDSLAFLDAMTNNYPTILQVKFIEARNSIEAVRKKTLEVYAKSIAGTWNVNGNETPEFDAERIRTTILTEAVVTDEEYKAFHSEMNTRFARTQQAWNTKQKKQVDDFSVEGDPEKIIRTYGEFFDEHSRNPFLSELTTKVDQAIQRYFRDFIGNYYCKDDMSETQRRFNKFRRVCLAFDGRGLVGAPILLMTSGRFAMLCNNRGKLNDRSRGIYSVFDQKIRITKIEAKFDVRGCSDNYKGLDIAVSLYNSRWNFGQKEFEVVSSCPVIDMKEASNSNGAGRIPRRWNDAWLTIWSGSPAEISFGPYTHPIMKVSYEDRLNGWFTNDDEDSKWFLLRNFSKDVSVQKMDDDISVCFRHGFYDSTDGVLQLRVTGQRIGDDYHDLAREAGLIRY